MGSLEPTSLRSIAPESVNTFKLLKLPIDSGSEMFIPQPFPLSIINFSNFFKFPISLGRSSKFSRQEISNSTKLIRVPNCDGRCFIAGSYFVMERVVAFSGATKACSKLSNDSACITEVKVMHMLAMNKWFFISRSPGFTLFCRTVGRRMAVKDQRVFPYQFGLVIFGPALQQHGADGFYASG